MTSVSKKGLALPVGVMVTQRPSRTGSSSSSGYTSLGEDFRVEGICCPWLDLFADATLVGLLRAILVVPGIRECTHRLVSSVIVGDKRLTVRGMVVCDAGPGSFSINSAIP
jgi:hypothetical protein